MSFKEFSWDEKSCDPKCFTGKSVLIGDMSTDDANRLVRVLSYTCNIKFDFYIDGTNMVISVPRDNYGKAVNYVKANIKRLSKEFNIKVL